MDNLAKTFFQEVEDVIQMFNDKSGKKKIENSGKSFKDDIGSLSV